MSNEIALFGNAPLPAHLQEGQGISSFWDDVGGSAVARIKMKGNILEVVRGTDVLARSAPLQPLRVVILRPSKVGRTYYAQNYIEGSKEAPDCYSNDGVKPAADAKAPQCARCDLCPWNVKGSGDNGESKKCRYRQTLAVWMPGENDSTWDTVFQLGLSSTAIFGDQKNDQGFMPLNMMMDVFRRAKLDPTKAWVDIAVDAYSQHKRIVMKPAALIEDPDEYAQVRNLVTSEEVERIIHAGVLDMDVEPIEGLGGPLPAHLQTQPAQQQVQNSPHVTNDQVTINPFTGEILYDDQPLTDTVSTYWLDTATGVVVELTAGTNLPVDYAPITEVTVAEFQQYQQHLAAERQRKAEEEARRKAEEEARRQAEADAAAAAATRTRTRGAAATQTEAPAGRTRGAAATQTEAPAGRTRGAATTQTEAPAGRTRGAATTQTETPAAEGGRRRNAAATATTTPPADATAGTRTRGAAATTTAPAAAGTTPSGRTSRRASVNAAQNTSADASPAIRQAQQNAAAAPKDEQPRVVRGGDAEMDPAVAAALNQALLQNND